MRSAVHLFDELATLGKAGLAAPRERRRSSR
jgi:hypothetical protein